MGWHYVAVRHENEGEVTYGLHEEFPDIQEGDERVVTEDPTAVIGDSPAELAKWLRHAADDVEKYAPIETPGKEPS